MRDFSSKKNMCSYLRLFFIAYCISTTHINFNYAWNIDAFQSVFSEFLRAETPPILKATPSQLAAPRQQPPTSPGQPPTPLELPKQPPTPPEQPPTQPEQRTPPEQPQQPPTPPEQRPTPPEQPPKPPQQQSIPPQQQPIPPEQPQQPPKQSPTPPEQPPTPSQQPRIRRQLPQMPSESKEPTPIKEPPFSTEKPAYPTEEPAYPTDVPVGVTTESQIPVGGDLKDIPDDIPLAIRRHNFNDAELLLFEHNDPSEIPQIVNEVYMNGSNSFILLINFTEALTTTKTSYYFLVAIYDETIANNHETPSQLIILAKAIRANFIDHVDENADPDLEEKGKALYDSVTESLLMVAPKVIARAMQIDKYQTILDLAIRIHVYTQEISDEVMEALVNITYGRIPSGKILSNIKLHDVISQQVYGITTLYWRVIETKPLDSPTVLAIATELKKLSDKRITENELFAIEEVVADLPHCARNLFFNNMICLWNVGTREYLYAENEVRDGQHRRVYTWWAGNPVVGSIWYPQKFGNQVYFKNHHQHHEYLYAAPYDYNADTRYVVTWFSGKKPEKQGGWDVELSGEVCYLKNARYNEHLFATSVVENEDKRLVLTLKNSADTRGKEFQWQVRTCEVTPFID